jgi:glycosyltransferase involved in cell wall biosynthesis
VALEAMACGVPTVSSNTGGIPELIIHGETGFLEDVGDTERMAEDVLKLLRDVELYKRVSEACLYRAQVYFCNNVITEQYEQIYYRVLSKEAPLVDVEKQRLSCLSSFS